MRVLAIDFGTSNTVAMLRTADGRMRPLLFDGSPLLPSAVYLDADGRMLVGRDAERQARLDPARFEANPKRCIDDGQILLGDAAMPVAHVFSRVLAYIASEAHRQLGGAPEEVRLTHPARWGDRRRSLLVEAARMAGLGNPRLIAEPVGAASYFTAVLGAAVPVGRSLAIYDLGGGTFDATVVRRTQAGFEVLAEEGLTELGGLDFDHAIVEHLGKAHEAANPRLWAQLVKPVGASDRRHRRLLYEDVRAAKEMLSRTSSTDIHLPALEVDAHLTREELETLVRPYLERTITCLGRAVNAAKLRPAELVGIFLVGGSSRIPLAAHLIHTELGVAPTTLEQPETVVVEGALCIGVAQPSGGVQPGLPRAVSAPPGHPAARPVSAQPAGGPRPVPAVQAAARPLSVPPVTPPPAGPGGVRPGGPGPTQNPPGPAVPLRPGPQPPQILRPVAVHQPSVAVRPTLAPPANVAPPRVQLQRPPPARSRYTDPAVVGTLIVLALIVVAFIALLVVFTNG